MVKIGILGCMGRMGQAIEAAVKKVPELSLMIGSERADHPLVGKTSPVSGLPITDQTGVVFDAADIVIDFTAPGNTAVHARMAADKQTKLLVGTTGMSYDDEAALNNAAKSVAVMQAGNYSVGVNVLLSLVHETAARLDADWDAEVLEMHHRNKVDAPSGTALMLGEAVADGRGQSLSVLRAPMRDGVSGARKTGSIGFAALRGGNVVGEHSVVFASDSETITLSHRAENRMLFADGAVRAAHWLAKQEKGRYSMRDVLGL